MALIDDLIKRAEAFKKEKEKPKRSTVGIVKDFVGGLSKPKPAPEQQISKADFSKKQVGTLKSSGFLPGLQPESVPYSKYIQDFQQESKIKEARTVVEDLITGGKAGKAKFTADPFQTSSSTALDNILKTNTEESLQFKEGLGSTLTGGYGFTPGQYTPNEPQGVGQNFSKALGTVVGFLPSIMGTGAGLTAVGLKIGLSKVLAKSPRLVQIASAIIKEGLSFGIVEGLSKPQEGETRKEKALSGLGTGLALGVAGEVLAPFGKAVKATGFAGTGAGLAAASGAESDEVIAQGMLFAILGSVGKDSKKISSETMRKVDAIAKEELAKNPGMNEAIIEIYPRLQKEVPELKLPKAKKVGLQTDKLPELKRQGDTLSSELLGIEPIQKKKTDYISLNEKDFNAVEKASVLKQNALEETIQNPIRVFEKMGLKEEIYRPVQEGEAAWQKEYKAHKTKLKENFKGLSKKSKSNIAVWAIAQEPSGAITLFNKGIEVPKLNSKEKAFFDAGRNIYDTLYDRINEVNVSIGRNPIPKRENYFPHIVEQSLAEELGMGLFSKSPKDRPVDFETIAPFFAFGKERKGSTRIELDAAAALNTYIQNSLRFIHTAKPLSKSKLLIDAEIANPKLDGEVFSFKESNPQGHRYITDWLEFVAGTSPEISRSRFMNELVGMGKKLSKNLAWSTLAFNASSAIIQPTAIIGTAAEIGPMWTLKGAQRLATGGSDFAMKNSNELIGRVFDIASADLKGKTGLRDKAAKIGIKPLEFLDSLTAQASWLGAFEKAKSQGMADKTAIKFADDVVVKTQGSGSKINVAEIQRGDLGRTLSLFQTFVINNFNWLRRDVLGIGNKDISKPEAIKKLVTYIAGVTAANVVYEDVMGVPSPFPRPMKAWMEEGPADAGEELLQLVPFIGGAVRFGGSNLLGPTGSYLGDIFYKLAGDKSAPSILEIAAKGAGIPGTRQAGKSISGLEAIAEGKDLYFKTITDKLRKKNVKIDELPDQVRAIIFGPYFAKVVQEERTKMGGEARSIDELLDSVLKSSKSLFGDFLDSAKDKKESAGKALDKILKNLK